MLAEWSAPGITADVDVASDRGSPNCTVKTWYLSSRLKSRPSFDSGSLSVERRAWNAVEDGVWGQHNRRGLDEV